MLRAISRPMFAAGLFAATISVSSEASRAAVATANAFDNSTVQPAGPRTGVNGQKFFNVENSSAGSFASFGVVDFHGSDLHLSSVTAINSVKLVLTESDAAFTAPGLLNFYLTQDTATNIDAGTSPLTFQSTSSEGLDAQLTPNHQVASALPFTTTGNTNTGTADTYTLSGLSSADKTYLINQLNSGGNIRLIVTPNSTSDPNNASVAATWAGFTNTTTAGPQLVIDAAGIASVPEPASFGLAVAAAIALCGRRRRA